MRKFGFFLTLILFGFFLHILLFRTISFFSVRPDILFLFVVSTGFLFGPIMGETSGFFFGLLADTLGVHLFGFQTFLFSLSGYVAGKLRRRIDSERPIPQIVIAFLGTLIYGLLASLIRWFINEAGHQLFIWALVFEGFINALIMPFAFWCVDKWALMWGVSEN